MEKIDFVNLDRDAFECLKLKASDGKIHRDLDGEAVILDLDTGQYLGLDETGTRIWTLLQESRSVREILDILLDEYDVEMEPCVHDLREFLRDLAGNGLIEVCNEADA
ncbi:MAG: PqqD family protein [Desulfobulbaceae bacterium]|nr:PqqD family protein [Desulfobulbaceae bacterium]